MCSTNIKTPLKMMEVNMYKLVLIALCFIMMPYTVSAACTRIQGCEEGERCDGEECIACEDRFYQDLPMHRQIACKPWTVKHASENWMVIVNGSKTRDVQYDCMPGYVQYTFAKEQIECVPATTTSTSTSTQAPTSVPSTPVNTWTTNMAQVTNQETFDKVYIIPICFAILVVAVVVMIVGHCIYKKCPKKSLLSRKNNGTARDPCGINSEESIPLTDYNKFLNLFSKILDLKRSRKFIRIIPDPSCQFKAQHRIQLNRDREPVAETYHARTLNDWLDHNPGINSETYVTWSTNYVKVDSLEKVSTVEINGEQLILPEAHTSISTDQCFNKLCYFLGENLGISLEAFIYDLMEDSNLQLKNIMDGYDREYNQDYVTAFVDTLVEWKSTQTEQLHIATRFDSALKQIDQNKLLDNKIYKYLIKEFELSLSQK